ncbi:MAG: autotransporter-associated beta strand repeat-containing protein [Kiritimatiellae bacterium]|nr:autotransporter-associated beta strand repeat-containing protein [Kiritimatiellia bacterium]
MRREYRRAAMRIVRAFAVAAACCAAAETVTVNAPAGTETNVLTFASGEDTLAINTGTTGGIVHPSPYSTHTGGTTLGSGTLVLQKPVGAEETTGELGAGPFVQQGGTLRYAGPAGGVWTRAVTNTASTSTGAVVWQIDNDLTMDCDVAQTAGGFVKTGVGTLTFTQPFNFGGTTEIPGSTRKSQMNLSPDRAPTQGHGNFSLVDGTVVIDTPVSDDSPITAPATNVLTAAGVATVGTLTTLDGTETTGVLEQRGGVTRTAGILSIGFCNGSTNNSETPLSPTVRVTGGRFLVGATGTSQVYMGVTEDIGEFEGQRNAPRLEVSTPDRFLCKTIHMGYTPGANSTIIVRDGGYLYGLDSHIYVGNYKTYTDPLPTTNYVEVSGSGSWMSFQHFYNDNKKNGMVTTFRIADGGTVEMRNFVNSAKGELHLIVDGGVWRHRNNDNATPHFPSTMTSVKVGPGGLTTYFNGGKETYPVIFEKGIEPLDDSGTDGGLHITQGSGAMPPLRINAANTYCGPTEITFTRVYLGKDGKLPSGTALTVSSNNGGLIITNGVQTVGSFTFGHDTTVYSPILGFGPGSRLDVTGETHVGTTVSAPKLHLFETQGMTNALVTPGTYTYVTARAEDARDLQQMAQKFTFPLKPDGVDYTCFVDVEGDRALLKVAVTPAGTPATIGNVLVVPSDPTTTNSPSAADVAAAKAIISNPAYPDNGTVELGALTGFGAGGTLTAWGGTTRVADLSFMQSEANLVLGFGTLVYTGPSAEIPGLTIDTQPSRSSVLSIAETNTTLTIRSLNAIQGSLSKMGPGTLHLAGTGEIMLPHNSKDNGNVNGMTPAGIGPGSGFRFFNVNEGKVVIGTVGDPADAPTVVSTGDFSVGSQSHRIGQDVQTTGELVMNNGVLDINSILYLGYYCGRYSDCPDLILHPTITQNGGELAYTTLRMGHGNASYYQTASPNLFIHAGTNTCRGTAAFAYSVVPLADTYRATVVIDGTGVMRVGNNIGLGWVDGAAGADLTVTGNGRLEVNDIYLGYKNTRETNTFHLSGNGVVRARNITGNSASFAYPVDAWFDGGTVESLVSASANSYIRYLRHAYVGAGGLNVDLSHQSELDGPTTYWLLIQQAFEHDPDLGETPDGGLTFTGAGTVSLGTGFENSTFTGGVRLRDGARAVIAAGYTAPFALDVGPGARLFDYDGTSNVVKNLVLGEAGATEPVVIEIERETGSYGIVVTDSLSILSPVAVTTHAGTHDLSPVVAPGTYTALVYAASNADVDLSKFTLPADAAQTATISADQVTVAGGDYNGMKAVVVTIAGASGSANGNAWTSVTDGGDWSDASNWSNATAGAPNGPWELATFNPATKAGVDVTLDEAVTLGGLTFNAGGASYGYTLSGQGLTLDGGPRTAVVANARGTNVIASVLTLASDAEIQTATGNELRLTGGVAGTGNLGVNTHAAEGGGQVNLKVASGYAGKVTTGCGRVVMDDLSAIQSADQLLLGPGTLLYTGPDIEFPGFQFSAGKGRAAIFENETDVTVHALKLVDTSAFAKTGTGTLRLHGTDTFSANAASNRVNATSRRGANGDAPKSATAPIAISTGTFVQGEVDDPENAPTVSVTGTLTVGSPITSGNATYVLNNGKLTTSSVFYLGYYAENLSTPVTLTFRQMGGDMVVNNNFACSYWLRSKQKAHTLIEINGGSTWVKGQLYMGMSTATSPSSQTCRLVMNGGSFATAGNMHFAYSNSTNKAYVDLNGGVLTCSNTLYAAYNGGNDVTVRLNPNGMFRCNAYAATAGNSVTRLYGDGGAFRPLCRTAAAETMAANVFTYLYASTNGLVVDTSETLNGAPFTMAQAILHDPDCEGADGGLVKRGAGLLTLTGANTYTGTTVVEEGILALSGAGTLGAGGGLAVANGAICDLGGTAPTVGDVVASGLVRNGALTVTEALRVGEGVLSVDGDLTLAGTATLDFAGRSELNLLAGEPVAVVTGTTTLPKTASAANAGDAKRVVFVREGAVVYALAAPGGTAVILR